ncbi:uncharacterized protein ABDE67_005999 [Symphorus nematophorus]
MAEEEVNYASVVFRPKKGFQRQITLSHKSEQKQLNKNITSLLAANHNLTTLNHNLSSENEKLKQDHNNLTVQLGNQTQAYRALESKITHLNAENQNFTTQIKKLNTKNKELETKNGELEKKKQELEGQKDGLEKKIKHMETGWNINVSQAQWSIDAYCPKENGNRRCEPCQKHWSHSQSSCYAINDAESDRHKTWVEAREDCKGKGSDLAVIDNQDEKTFISNNSWRSSGTKGYWIGLRAKDGKWKWLNGTDLTETSWIQQRPTDGHCAISVHNEGWKSVNCSEKQMWICGKAALFV